MFSFLPKELRKYTGSFLDSNTMAAYRQTSKQATVELATKTLFDKERQEDKEKTETFILKNIEVIEEEDYERYQGMFSIEKKIKFKENKINYLDTLLKAFEAIICKDIANIDGDPRAVKHVTIFRTDLESRLKEIKDSPTQYYKVEEDTVTENIEIATENEDWTPKDIDSNQDRSYVNFFSTQTVILEPETCNEILETEISDEEMANSAFGQGSDTARAYRKI